MRLALIILVVMTKFASAGIGNCQRLLTGLTRQQARDIVVDLRHGDLDPYGHVSSSRYLEFLSAALWRDGLDFPLPEAGPSISVVDLDFKRGIRDASNVIVSLAAKGMVTRFRIFNKDKTREHASGKIEIGTEKEVFAHPQRVTSPVVYESETSVRYDDLNSHNELELGRYLELITASRFHFFRDRFGLTGEDLMRKGLAFYNTSMHLRFHLCCPGRGDRDGSKDRDMISVQHGLS